MDGIIRLLPDLVANQIAAGEVIQRPASVVKELMENSVDAGAGEIELWINDAGKKLVMVVDNGKGMSPADSRLCFERHATSKMARTEDLFNIRTLGFRGEALASIAAVAQLEMKTRRKEEEMATMVRIEGRKFTVQEPCAHPIGTTIAVKNLFFNVPARRNFLKSNNVEMKHITEEFIRVALPNEQVSFRFYNDGKEQYHLSSGNLKQRIVGIYGGQYNSRVVPIEQETGIVTFTGYIGKPEFARKHRGEQYFFVNGRFFKSPYLHHAVMKAYSELIPESNIPSYFIFMEVDPSLVDVNIHPTKTEVNFVESQAIYTILNTAVRNSLGKHNLTPTIEFEPENGFSFHFPKDREVRPPEIRINPDYNPFSASQTKGESIVGSSERAKQTSLLNQRGWEKLYEGFPTRDEEQPGADDSSGNQAAPQAQSTALNAGSKLIQVHGTYIVTSIKSGLLIINQQLAHQRILYDRFLKEIHGKGNGSQQLLVPLVEEMTPEEQHALEAMKEHLTDMGFRFTADSDAGKIIFEAIPSEIPQDAIHGLVHNLINEWIEERTIETGDPAAGKIARAMACRLSIKTGSALSHSEMQALVDQLFTLEHPETSPTGKRVFVIIPHNEVEERFSGN